MKREVRCKTGATTITVIGNDNDNIPLGEFSREGVLVWETISHKSGDLPYFGAETLLGKGKVKPHIMEKGRSVYFGLSLIPYL